MRGALWRQPAFIGLPAPPVDGTDADHRKPPHLATAIPGQRTLARCQHSSRFTPAAEAVGPGCRAAHLDRHRPASPSPSLLPHGRYWLPRGLCILPRAALERPLFPAWGQHTGATAPARQTTPGGREEPWDEVMILELPSAQTFVDIISAPQGGLGRAVADRRHSS